MPGGDRTGPGGMGPLTGRGMGNCAGARPAGYGRGVGRGMGRGGFGRGMGRGGGFGRGFGWGYSPSPVSPADEAGMLKSEASALQEELKAVQARISALDSDNKK